jgi:HD-GYP domain-containing protein (c-di-GMP phosphodiesterase class II)
MKHPVENSLKKVNKLLQITDQLNHIKDVDSLLDNILHEARQLTKADSGTIFLRDGNQLKFSYFQNDSFERQGTANNRYLYSVLEVPINDESIAGYVALTGQSVIIDDAYCLPKGVPYDFNKAFDQTSGYRSQSVLTVPLTTTGDTVIGVMQILNAKGKSGEIISFTENDLIYVNYFANNAAVVLERAKMTREIILRMVRMSELRDPKETGNHVNRVAAYTIEIFEKWAKTRGIQMQEIKKRKDVLRISAMLHDVGKVAISDTILKKPAKLSEDEFEIMKRHTVFGAQLFDSNASDWDALSATIALRHHEKYDGTGYPGKYKILGPEEAELGKGLKGEEIPIEARIVALADVYDALISKRVYKEPWSEDDVLAHIRSESGKHFDPEVVDAFLKINDIIRAIREKYSD